MNPERGMRCSGCSGLAQGVAGRRHGAFTGIESGVKSAFKIVSHSTTSSLIERCRELTDSSALRQPATM